MESSKPVIEKRGIRPQKDQIFYCPRCNSTNTKFCYYNNYSLTQPRYFCKTCRRYWTEGGSLRNVPVGGGSRKNKRSSSTSSPSSSSSRNPVSQNPNKFLQGGQDLNLAYPPPNIHEYSISSFSKYIEVPSNFANGKSVLHLENPNSITTPISSHFPSMEFFGSHHQESRGCDTNHPNGGAAVISKLVEVPYVFGNDKITPGNPSFSTTASPYFASIELFKTEESNDIANTSSKRQVSSLQEPVSDNPGTITFSSMGFPMQEFKPSVNFSSDEYDNNDGGYGNLHGMQQQQQTNGARVLFPFQDNLKQVSSGSSEQQFDDRNRGQGDSNTGFWKGMVNGGSW